MRGAGPAPACAGCPCILNPNPTPLCLLPRLEPLLLAAFPCSRSLCRGPGSLSFTGTGATAPVPPPAAADMPQLVWETTCEQTWRAAHSQALVLNKLHNSTVLEDKANLAFLQVGMRGLCVCAGACCCCKDIFRVRLTRYSVSDEQFV